MRKGADKRVAASPSTGAKASARRHGTAPRSDGSIAAAAAPAAAAPLLTLDQLRDRVLAQWPHALAHLAERSADEDGQEEVAGLKSSDSDNAVRPLWLRSVPSAGLPAELRELFCRAPRRSSPYHPCSAPAFIGSLARVRKISAGTLVPDPYAVKNQKKRQAGASDATSKPVRQVPHPAAGQCGLFACARIPPNTFLGPYLGVVHTEAESNEESNYDLRLWAYRRADASTYYSSSEQAQEDSGDADEEVERIPLGVDATHAGGVMRFVNDFRGILPRPNVFFQDWEDEAGSDIEGEGIDDGAGAGVDAGEEAAGPDPAEKKNADSAYDSIQPDSATSASRGRVRGIGLFTGAHSVEAGTELCVSYGKGFWQARE